MSDPRTILERAARRIDPRSDAFERLDRRRERKARNRRITAGVVALLVAIGGSYAAFNVFRDSSGGTIGAEGDSGFHALWPEVTLADAQSAQRQFLTGDPDLAWRVDAGEVSARFVHESLGWDGYSVQAIDTPNAASSGPVEVLVQHLTPEQALASASPVPACDPAAAGGCPTTEQQDSVVVVLDRLVDPGGVWSVVEVYDPAISLRLPISSGATVVSGQEYLIPFQVLDGFQAEVGYAYIAPDCGGGVFTNYATADVSSDGIRFTVADMSFEQSCEPGQAGSIGGEMDPNGADLNRELDGYVFVAIQPTGAQQDDPFDTSLPLVTRDAPVSVAGVPVHFVPVTEAPSGTIEPLPTVAQVTCSDAGTQVDTPVVQPQPDGVHIAIDNPTGTDLGLQIKDFGGDNAPVGSTEIVRPIPPGVYGLACTDPQSSAEPTYEPFEVQDPARIWVSTDLSGCTSASGIAGSAAPGSDVAGVPGSPIEAVNTTISGLLSTDLIELAGYTSATDEATVRVVRDGDVVASYHLFPDTRGGWYIDSAQACDGTGLASLGSGGGVSGSTGAGGGLPTCTPDTGANGGPDGTQLHLVSQDITFDLTCLNAPAGTAFTILFDNLDPGAPKNVSIYPMVACATGTGATGGTATTGATGTGTTADAAGSCPNAGSAPVFTGEIIDGTGNGVEIVYHVPSLDAGTYYFQDDVHPEENGVLIIG